MTTEEAPSRRTLDEAAGRVLTFLMGVGKSPLIRTILAAEGYDEEEHQHAWALLSKLAAYGPNQKAVLVDVAVRNAVVELDAWDEPNFARIKAILGRLHPEQADFVFKDLEPSQGPQSVIGISTLLDRLDALKNDPERKATRKADQAALATLAKRRYTEEERERLHGLVKVAQTVVMAGPVSDDERTAIQRELHGWISEWGTTAKVVLKRRDHQIQVGVAQRKKSKKKGAKGSESAPPAAGQATPAPAVGGAPSGG